MNKVALCISILTIIVLVVGGYVLVQKLNTINSQIETLNNTNAKIAELESRVDKLSGVATDSTSKDTSDDKTSSKKKVEFDPDKMKVAYEDCEYEVTESFDLNELGLKVNVEDGKAFINVKKNDTTKELYEIGEEVTDQEITGFKAEPTMCFTAIAGQDLNAPVLCFLMDDGTVEYYDTSTELKKEKYASQGKIKGLENIVGFEVVSVHENEGGGFVSSVAIDEDGYSYDIFKIVER